MLNVTLKNKLRLEKFAINYYNGRIYSAIQHISLRTTVRINLRVMISY